MAKQKSLFQLDAQAARLEQALKEARRSGRISPQEYVKRSTRVLLASMEYGQRMEKHAKKILEAVSSKV